jgi:hypothetical protein
MVLNATQGSENTSLESDGRNWTRTSDPHDVNVSSKVLERLLSRLYKA